MAALQTEILADSPTVYVKLDETSGTAAADASGNSHNGTHSGGVTVNQATLRADGVGKSAAYATNGITTLTTLGTLGSNLVTSTWEFIVKTTSTAGPLAVFGVVNAGTTLIAACYVNSSGQALQAGGLDFHIRDAAGVNQLEGNTGNVGINDGNPHHVVWQVTSSTTLACWVDGVAKTIGYTTQQAIGGQNFGVPMTLGARNVRGTPTAIGDRFLTGTLDEFAAYPTRLSGARILVHAAAARVVSLTAGQGTATGAGTAVTFRSDATLTAGQGTATASGTAATFSSASSSSATMTAGQGTAVASGNPATFVAVNPTSATMTAGQGTAVVSGRPAFFAVNDASTRLAIPASLQSGFAQAVHLYDQVAVNTHFIYIDTPYGNYNQVIQHLSDLGIRHIREGIIASWFDARSGSSDAALAAIHAYNQGLTGSEQPIFVNGGTTEFPPQQPHPYTVQDWMATMDGGHQHYNNDSNSGIPGAIPGVGGPLPDATKPWATPEIPWGIFSSIQSSNEPQGDVSLIPNWQHTLKLEKDQRTQGVFEGLPYVTPNGLQPGGAEVHELPVIGSVAMTNGSWDLWGDMSAGTNVIDVGDLHVYMGGTNPSFEHVSNEIFNARSFNGRLKLPLESHYPASSLPLFMTETGWINSGNDSPHFPIPNDVIAVYLINTLLINAKLGIRRTFIYELLDEADLPNSSERNFGLIRFNGVWKDQAYAIRNYLSLTEFSEAPPEDQQPIDYTISGFTPGPQNFQTHQIDGSQYDQNPDRLDHLLVQQDAHRWLLWVWRQKNLYNREEQTYATVDTQTLTLELGDLDVASVSLARPTAGGTSSPDDGLVFTPLTYVAGNADFDIAGAPVAISITVRPPAQTAGMSSFVLNRSDVFPVGTSVGLYTQLNPATQQPLGPLNQSSTVGSDGTVTFVSLSDGVTYYAYAVVNSEPRHVSFQTTATVSSGGGGLEEETDPLSPKLVPAAAQSIVPSADVPALTLKSYSGAASDASVFEARDAAASDALRLKVTKEGTVKTYRTNAFFPNFQAFGAATDTQPQAQINGNAWALGPGGSTAPDLPVARTTNTAAKAQLSVNGRPVASSPYLNVVDYGALGNGSTNDTPAFQAAVDALVAGSGGTIVVPPSANPYLIGSPGIVIPQNCQKSITIVGRAAGSSATSSWPVRLIRDGTHAILSMTGTGITDSTFNHSINLQDILLDGNKPTVASGTLVSIGRLANSFWKGVTLKNSAGIGLLGQQMWNIHFTDCYFTGTGNNAGALPAVKLTDAGAAGSGTNTVHFTACEFEHNTWDDIQVDGPTQAAGGVIINGCKFERTEGIAVRLLASTACVIADNYAFVNVDNPAFAINSGSANTHTISGNVIATSGGSTPTNCIYLVAGNTVSITGNAFLGGANHIRLDSGFGMAAIVGNVGYTALSPVLINDLRSSKTGVISANGRLVAYDGLGTKIKAGAVVDGDFSVPAQDGMTAVDTTNHRFYWRSGGVWHYANKDAASP